MTIPEERIRDGETYLGVGIVGPKRVLIADDSEFMRVAYKRILETQECYEVVALAVNGRDALNKAARFSPDVALMDIRMPEMDGIEATNRIVEILPDIAIVIISAYDDPAFLAELFRNGPERKAYILKNSLADIEELLRTVDAVTQGQTVLDPGMIQKVARLYCHDPHWLAFGLTAVEQDVLELATEGFNDPEIATEMRLTPLAVQNCLEEIYQKFDLSQGGQTERRVAAVQVFVKQIVLAIEEIEDKAS